MALGVKESVSGKRLLLDANGDEIRVCGGKGAVYLSGPKVALRCCAKTSIVATRKAKQSVLRQGDVLLLDLRDTFYANGTLTKYEVIAMDDKPKVSLMAAATATKPVVSAYFQPKTNAKLVVTAAPLRPQKLSQEQQLLARDRQKAAEEEAVRVSPVDVADSPVEGAAWKRPKAGATSRVVLDEDDAVEGGDGDDGSDDEDDHVPVRRTKKARMIVESDGEHDEEDEAAKQPPVQTTPMRPTKGNAMTPRSDLSSPAEDDVYARELQLKQAKTGPAARSTAWMEAFGRNRQQAATARDKNGWQTARRGDVVASTAPRKRQRLKYEDDGDDDLDEDHSSRAHDEVGQILIECERIADKLRDSIQRWAPASPSDATEKAASTEEDGDGGASGHVSLASINTSSSSPDRNIYTQADIPDVCSTLVLKPYQVVGLNWLLLLHENNLSGVLADEMGLGKTVQTIAFLLLLETLAKNRGEQTAGPHLIVVPASVLNNWKREFAWIAPTIRIVVYHGSKDDRLDMQEELEPDSFDVLLTTYTYFERDSCQDDRTFLRSFRFGHMILDEGHSIKNSKSSRFKRISAMRARSRLVLSGTPIQNNLNELLALLSFLMPRMFDHGSDELLSFFDGTEEKKCAKVRAILAPFILRREKRYVLNQLVAKKVEVKMVQLGEAQRKVYVNLLDSVLKQKEDDLARKQEEKDRKKKSRNKLGRQMELLLGGRESSSKHTTDGATDSAIFTQLRKAANHPVLLRNHYTSDDDLETLTRCLHRAEAFGNQCSMAMVRKELETYSDFELHDLCVQYGANEELRKLQLPTETLLASAKFDYLQTLLPSLKQDGHRVLIFSQWTRLLDLLEVLMDHMQYRYLRLDGSTDVASRQELIDTYNEDKDIFVFLLSTRAGGLGINLTAADTVVLHDLDFNPTNDEQACDRCHRIGQTKPVTIYKLVAEDTVDNHIYSLGEAKTQLNNAVLGKLNAFGGRGSNGKSDKKNSDTVTVEMMLASVLSSHKKSRS
ncbi:TPA: hypothetical protein N0F65_011300 [Lagenidium giganteum]|uniref:SNF2 family DNA-dependent ATPase n=1 Tax=Lagenidium giganteum TaxID=4803 RepID=A0AAV2YVS1_9STRA|nr:TPA: hypothetical protein N0F65_011300 [Lagenidium giganteum]